MCGCRLCMVVCDCCGIKVKPLGRLALNREGGTSSIQLRNCVIILNDHIFGTSKEFGDASLQQWQQQNIKCLEDITLYCM